MPEPFHLKEARGAVPHEIGRVDINCGAGDALLLEAVETAPHAKAIPEKLGANPDEVKLATRSRKGYWRMSSNRIVQQALTNRWLEEQGVPDMRTSWIILYYGPIAQV